MSARFVLTEYLNAAMESANYDKLEDGTYGGRVPTCHGVVAFGATTRACEEELHSVLEDWVLVGLKLGHHVPLVAGLDLNQETAREPMDAV